MAAIEGKGEEGGGGSGQHELDAAGEGPHMEGWPRVGAVGLQEHSIPPAEFVEGHSLARDS